MTKQSKPMRAVRPFLSMIAAMFLLWPGERAGAATKDEAAWAKLDRGLRDIYTNYLELRTPRNAPGVWIHPVIRHCFRPRIVECQLSVTVSFTGPAGALDPRFHLQSVEREGVANGMIDLKDLAAVSHDANLTKLQYGEDMEPTGEYDR